MPRFDGTGPQGRGSKTGRGMGNCPTDNNLNQPSNMGNQGFSRGPGGGRGQGGGKGMGRGGGRGKGRQNSNW